MTAERDLWVLDGPSAKAPTAELSPALIDVRITHSPDLGKTFEPTTSAVDPAAGSRYMRAMGAVGPNRELDLVYYAGGAENDTQATVRHSRSTDKGKTFPPSKVLFSPTVLVTDRRSSQAFGDLLGVANDESDTFAAFVDNTSGVARVRLARISR
jgi:hypothetical protein